MNKLQVNGAPIDYSELPEHLRNTMQLYLEHQLQPGSFMIAVLSNDLRDACGRADNINRHLLFEIVSWLYNNAPTGAWGSPENVKAWLSREGGYTPI